MVAAHSSGTLSRSRSAMLRRVFSNVIAAPEFSLKARLLPSCDSAEAQTALLWPCRRRHTMTSSSSHLWTTSANSIDTRASDLHSKTWRAEHQRGQGVRKALGALSPALSSACGVFLVTPQAGATDQSPDALRFRARRLCHTVFWSPPKLLQTSMKPGSDSCPFAFSFRLTMRRTRRFRHPHMEALALSWPPCIDPQPANHWTTTTRSTTLSSSSASLGIAKGICTFVTILEGKQYIVLQLQRHMRAGDSARNYSRAY